MTNAPKNLAELKRFLRPGVKLRLTHSRVGPTPPERQERVVKAVRLSSLTLSRSGGQDTIVLNWPKASDVVFGEFGFTIYAGVEEELPEVMTRYEYVPGGAE